MKLLKNRVFIGAVVLGLVALFIVIQAVRSQSNRAQVAKVEQMGDDMMKEMTIGKLVMRMVRREKGPPTELREKGKAMFEEMKKLPPEQREDMAMDFATKFMGKAARELWAMDPKDRNAILYLIAGADQGRPKGNPRPQGDGANNGDRPERPQSSGRSPDERRDAMARKFLDNTTAEERAMMIAEIGQINVFRHQMGLPPFSMAPPPRRQPRQQ